MTSPFDSMIAFPVSRAQAYAHTWPEDPSPEAAPIADLGIDHLIVDTLVYPGTVTLAASTRNAVNDAYGQEYDLTPSAAQALGRQLIAAAAECERAG
jgi:capsular polysaccharide biosynthesis protein